MRLMRLWVGLLVASTFALGDSFAGTLVDVMCKDKDLAGHTRECALACARSGFGLVLSDGKFLKFDESGNARALAALKASKKQNHLKAKVTGAVDGSVLKVESIELE